MHRFVRFVLAAAAVTLSLATQSPAQDPLTVGPDVYALKLENERVRVMEVTFAPGASIALHSHPDHAVYVVEGGTLVVTDASGKDQTFEIKAGDSFWMPAQSHSARNPGTTNLKLVVVEVK